MEGKRFCHTSVATQQDLKFLQVKKKFIRLEMNQERAEAGGAGEESQTNRTILSWRDSLEPLLQHRRLRDDVPACLVSIKIMKLIALCWHRSRPRHKTTMQLCMSS